MKSPTSERLRAVIQKLTEAIWNLDQLELLTPELKEEYARIQLARANLMKAVRQSKEEREV
jgi:hypothetical protein